MTVAGSVAVTIKVCAVSGLVTVAIRYMLTVATFIEIAVKCEILEVRREIAVVRYGGQSLIDTRRS